MSEVSLDDELRAFERRLRESGRDPFVELAQAERDRIRELEGLNSRYMNPADFPLTRYVELTRWLRDHDGQLVTLTPDPIGFRATPADFELRRLEQALLRRTEELERALLDLAAHEPGKSASIRLESRRRDRAS